MKRTPLYDIEASQGAVFEDSSGWLMPKSYGNASDEYLAVRKNVGIVDLSHRGKLRLSGREHIKFLQGMLTNDVHKLPAGKGLYATLLTPKGRMVTDMKVYRDAESVLLDLEPGLNGKVKDLLIKYRLSYKATVEDVTDALALISVQGPSSGKLIQKTLGAEIGELQEYDILSHNFADIEVLLIKVNRTGEEGYDLFVSGEKSEDVWKRLIEGGEEFQLIPIGLDAMEALRIEAAIPKFGVDMDENTIPIEAGIWHALNFEKGCYVGQEVVARIKWRGHVNRHLAGLSVDGENLPYKEDKIFNGEREVGHITSSLFSPFLKKIIALGYIRREFIEPGTKVTIESKEGKKEAAEVVKTPFYQGF